MRPSVRNILYFFGTLLIIALVAVVVSADRNSRRELTCEGLEVTILENYNFVTPEDIRATINERYGHFIGMPADSLDLTAIEKTVDARTAVLKSEVWKTREGMLHVRVTQRKPVLRLQKEDLGMYVDDRGCLFPLQESYVADVPEVDGSIPVKMERGKVGEAGTEKERQWIRQIMELVDFVESSPVWSENICRISVLRNSDIVLYPTEGRETFIFGKPDRIAEKFEGMEKYYTHIVPSKEEGYYGSVNLKYEGQIICKK